jgi:hypothetical protein
MEILIAISLITAVVVVWRVKGFWTSLLLSISMSFLLWAEIGNIAVHPLVLWRQYFVIGSVAVSATCFLAVWGVLLLIQHLRGR